MKKIKYIVLVTILQFSVKVTKAQNQTFITLQNPENIRAYLQGKYDLKNIVCENSFTFLKFKINADGDIQDLDFSKNTPEALKAVVKEKILKSNGFWKLKESDKPVITKITFYTTACFYV